MKKLIMVAIALILTLSADSCAVKPLSPVPAVNESRVSVVTTVFPLYDFARAVAGDDIELSLLLKPGTEIHSFEPTPADIIKIQQADLLLYIGGNNEIWVQRLLDSMEEMAPRSLMLLNTVEAVTEEVVEGMEADDKDEGLTLDEHIWTSPANAVKMINAIADALAKIDPAYAEEYQANAAAYREQIWQLDTEFKETVSTASRRIMVFGDRFPFRYFAKDYGLQYRAAFPGCSADTDPAASTLAYLINTVRNNDLPYIFYIELSNENVARAICEQTGAKRLLFHSCQQISRDDFEAGATYISIMQKNAENLRKGLN